MRRFYKYIELTPEKLLSAIKKCPLFFVPTGLIEWHGNHLPLGFDALKAEAICFHIARRTGGIILPPCYFGVAGFGSFAGTLIFKRPTVRSIFLELFTQLEKVGAKIIVLLTGHYGDYQVTLVKEVAKKYMQQSNVKIIAQPEYEDIFLENRIQPADHADKWETSFGLALMPHLIKMNKFKPGSCAIHKYNPEFTIPEYRKMEKHEWIWRSDLRKTASAELGRIVLKKIIVKIAYKIEKLKSQMKLS
jgi:creatinine amidohydrolase